MANESLYNQLLGELTKNTGGAFTAGSLRSTSLSSELKFPAEALIRPTGNAGTKSAGFGAKETATPIKFGAPSQKNQQPVLGTSTDWEKLASSVASGGVASLISGSGVGSLGLGSIVSGLIGLFGRGKKTPAPLTLFQLPASQDVVINVGSGNQTVATKLQSSNTPTKAANTVPSASSAASLKNTAVQATQPASTAVGNAHPPQSTSTQPAPTHVAPTDVNSQWFMDRSSDIAAAVRNAMLNSSSLNDVVADI